MREAQALGPTMGLRPGSELSSETGCLGIAKLILPCRKDTAQEIGSFYRRIFRFEVRVRVRVSRTRQPNSSPTSCIIVGQDGCDAIRG